MITEFLIYTIVAWLANACIAKILYISIQPGQWLDKLLNWQERLHKWDLQGYEFLVKNGGLCELCFSHIVSFIGFWVYLLFMQTVIGYWITAPVDNTIICMLVNVIWYLGYVAISTNLSLYFITKLFQR